MVVPDRKYCPTVIHYSSNTISDAKCFWSLVLIYSGLIFSGHEGIALEQAIASTETVTVQSSSIASDSNPKTPANSPAVQATQQSPRAKPPYSFQSSDLGPAFAFDRSTVIPKHEISQIDTQPPDQPQKLPPDKSQYSLFNPTPRELWRELTTDRPDRTESPYTVDAGAFQAEIDLFVYTRDTNNSEGTRIESFDIFIPNLKIGLTNNIDFQIIPEVYRSVRIRPKGGKTEETSGFGDLTLRMKVNLWGNDGGKTAFGIMPFVKLPTNQNNLGNNAIEGGIIFPLAISLSDKWDVGMMTEFDFNKNEADAGYNVGFVNSISFGYGINSQWSTYFELYTEVTTESGSQFIATFDAGLKYLVTENIQLDAGINIGLTRATDDFQPFVGISVRF